MTLYDDLLKKAQERAALENGTDQLSEIDNADFAQYQAPGLPQYEGTSIPLQAGLTNAELAQQPAPVSQNVDRAPAVMPGPRVNRGPASIEQDSPEIPGGQESSETDIQRLERLMAGLNEKRNKDIDDAASRQLKGNLINALASNIGNIVGGAQAMNTKASVTPAKVQGVEIPDLQAIVERKYKPEQEQLMAQYKALKDANQPLTEYQKLMLQGMAEQRDIQRMNAANAMDRFGKTHDRLLTKQEWQEQQKDEYSDKQSESLIGFDKTDQLLSDIENKVTSGKYDKYLGPYASKYENMKTMNPLSAGMDTDFAAFQSDVTDSLSQYIKGLSGLTVSDKERTALQSSMPKVGDKPQEFMAKLKATKARLAKMKSVEEQALAKYQGKKGSASSSNSSSPAQDPKIEAYAKQHGLDYSKAESILRARGYNGK